MEQLSHKSHSDVQTETRRQRTWHQTNTAVDLGLTYFLDHFSLQSEGISWEKSPYIIDAKPWGLFLLYPPGAEPQSMKEHVRFLIVLWLRHCQNRIDNPHETLNTTSSLTPSPNYYQNSNVTTELSVISSSVNNDLKGEGVTSLLHIVWSTCCRVGQVTMHLLGKVEQMPLHINPSSSVILFSILHGCIIARSTAVLLM